MNAAITLTRAAAALLAGVCLYAAEPLTSRPALVPDASVHAAALLSEIQALRRDILELRIQGHLRRIQELQQDLRANAEHTETVEQAEAGLRLEVAELTQRISETQQAEERAALERLRQDLMLSGPRRIQRDMAERASRTRILDEELSREQAGLRQCSTALRALPPGKPAQ